MSQEIQFLVSAAGYSDDAGARAHQARTQQVGQAIIIYSKKCGGVDAEGLATINQLKSLEKKPFLGLCYFYKASRSFLQISLPLTSQARVQHFMADSRSPVFLWQSPNQLWDRASLLFFSIDLLKYYLAYSYFSSRNNAAPTLWQFIELFGSMLTAFLWFSMAASYYFNLYRAAPRLRQYAGTFGSISMAFLVRSALACMLPSLPSARPFMLQNQLQSFSQRPLSQQSMSSFHLLRCMRALAFSMYLSILGGRLLAYSSSSLYCFFDLSVLILDCFSWAKCAKLIGFPCSISYSSISIFGSYLNCIYYDQTLHSYICIRPWQICDSAYMRHFNSEQSQNSVVKNQGASVGPGLGLPLGVGVGARWGLLFAMDVERGYLVDGPVELGYPAQGPRHAVLLVQELDGRLKLFLGVVGDHFFEENLKLLRVLAVEGLEEVAHGFLEACAEFRVGEQVLQVDGVHGLVAPVLLEPVIGSVGVLDLEVPLRLADHQLDHLLLRLLKGGDFRVEVGDQQGKQPVQCFRLPHDLFVLLGFDVVQVQHILQVRLVVLQVGNRLSLWLAYFRAGPDARPLLGFLLLWLRCWLLSLLLDQVAFAAFGSVVC